MRILVKEHQSVLSDLVFDPEIIYIGSRPDCGIHLPDMRVHQLHARLKPGQGAQWVIEHLAGDADTWVNGRRLRASQPLGNGDQVKIEDYSLHIYLDWDRTAATGGVTPLRQPEQHPLPDGALLHSRSEPVVMQPEQAADFARLGRLLGGCADLSALIEETLGFMLNCFKIRTVWLGLRQRNRGPLDCTQGRDFNGHVVDAPAYIDALTHRCVDRGQGVCVPRLRDMPAASLVAVPLTCQSGRLGLLYVDARLDSPPYDEAHLAYMMLVGRLVAAFVEAMMHERVRMQREISDAESSIVQAIQSRLDPYVVPVWPELQVAVHCSPGKDHVGDVYDIARLPNGAAAFFVGHVSAEAVAAAVAMIEARSAFRIAVVHSDMPHVMMHNINALLCGQKVVMNAAIVLLDPRTGALLHALAGPPCAAVIGQSGEPRHLDHPQAPLMGVDATAQFATRKGLLGDRESLAMYTSGVGRIQDAEGREWGMPRLLESLCDGFGMSARTALDETISDITDYMANGYQPEDVTLVLAHRGPA